MTKELPWWIVSRMKGSRAEEITRVRAKDAASAISFATKESSITNPEHIKRLVARPG